MTISYSNLMMDCFLFRHISGEFIWKPKNKCEFIESLILGLPIPFMFVADTEEGNLEIVDGAQRIQTLESFFNNDLQLANLTKLPLLNGFRYLDLPSPQQKKLKTKPLRMIVLEDKTSLEIRQEIFKRINRSAEKVRGSEVRRFALGGAFMEFVKKCAEHELFRELCPIGESAKKRREDEELVIRFFAYSDRYKSFKHAVENFLNKFVQDNKDNFDQKRMNEEFENTLKFVKRYFPNGFAKSPTSKSTPRVRFEALAVGVNLALRTKPDLIPKSMDWLDSEEFKLHTTTHASNSSVKLRGRLEFVRDHLLGKAK